MTEAALPQAAPRSGWLRVCRRLIWKLVLWFVIGSAALVSMGRLLAPYADHGRPLVERALSEALNQPVQIGRIEARWPRLSPQIQLRDLTVGTPENAMLQVDRARLELKLYNLVRPDHNSIELIALGLNLGLIEDEVGRWSWQIEGGGEVQDGWQRGLSAGDLKLRGSTVRVVPNGYDPLVWDVPEANLSRLGERSRIQFQAYERSTEGAVDDPAPVDVQIELTLSDTKPDLMRAYLSNAESRLPAQLAGLFGQDLGTYLNVDRMERIQTATEIWLDWTEQQPFLMHARVGLNDLSSAETLELVLDGVWQTDDWALQINLSGQESGPMIQDLTLRGQDQRLGLSLAALDLAGLYGVVSSLLNAHEFVPTQLGGQVHDVALAWHDDFTPFLASGQISGFDIVVGEPSFGLSGLDVMLGLNGDRYRLTSDGPVALDWAFLYRRVLPIDRLQAVLDLTPERLDVQHLAVATDVVSAVAEGTVLSPNSATAFAGPFMDLTIDVTHLSADPLNRWVPLRGLPPRTRVWLNQSLIALDRGRAVITLHGWPVGWKTFAPSGAVHSVIEIEGLDLAYGDGWPLAEDMNGWLEFESERMLARIDSGTVTDTSLQAPRIYIPYMRQAEIELQLASVNATAAQLHRLIQSLPLPAAQDTLAAMQWQGQAAARANVMLPVKRIQQWQLDGAVELTDVRFGMQPTGFEVTQLTGTIPHTRDQIGPASLQGVVLDQPISLTLDSQFVPSFSLTVNGRLPTAALVPLNWLDQHPSLYRSLTDRLSGMSAWQMSIAPAADVAAASAALELRLSSDLAGTELSLPEPLSKPSEQAWPFELSLALGDWTRPFRFSIQDVVDGQMQIEPDFWQLGLGFGGEIARMPAAENFYITGNIPRLEMTEWVGLSSQLFDEFGGFGQATRGMNDSVSGWLDLSIDLWWLGNTQLGPVQLGLAREEEIWRLRFAGDDMRGDIRTPATPASLPVAVARFDYLHWPLDETDTAAREPLMIDPRGLPELQLMISDFRWGELALGQMRVVSHTRDDGLEIEQFSLAREGLELTGSGRWVVSPEQTEYPFRTEARLRLTDDNLGSSINQAGFQLSLERGSALIELDGFWPGSPIDFGLTRLNGDLDLLIDDGVIAEAQPGAGRLLGLVSLGSIPRRLRLDFSDVFGSGFGFDRVEGHFDIEYGLATTDNLQITAPAADIQIQGQTNLADRVYNQTMRVRPGLGSTLPIIGALTGGPIGAAAGVALEQLLNEPISGLS
ncbi:MAG: AsmA-like C-terminal region-containing protein, partial [Pseudomonadota bacterium]